MSEEELGNLTQDLREQGLLRPIVLYEEMILDGRNRYRACQRAEIEPRFEIFQGTDPYAFVWGENAERRHLRADQKVAIRLLLESERGKWQGKQRQAQEEANRKRSEAAKAQPRSEDGSKLASTSSLPGAVSHDTAPAPDGRTRNTLAEETGVSSATAARVLSLANSRPDLLAQVAEGVLSSTKAHRQKKKDELSHRVDPLPEAKYRVLYADPPWKYGDSRGELDNYGPAERHYPCLSIPELCQLDILSLTEENSVLFLWVPSPLLEEAFPVIRAWGFQYKASFVWDKVRHNFGHYNSVRHEFLLLCTRGSCLPNTTKLIDSVQEIERSDRHSEKPEAFREIIETLYPQGKRLELFARHEREGWDAWGNEVPLPTSS